MTFLRWLALGLALTAAMPALALQPDEVLADKALEARARDLSRALRCMVCQNQSIDDSDAPLARDLRLLVRERLKAGDSDEAVLDYLTARYGDFVLLKPRFGWDTLLLWLAPGAVLLLGAWGVAGVLRRRPSEGGGEDGAAPLTSAERERVAALVNAHDNAYDNGGPG